MSYFAYDHPFEELRGVTRPRPALLRRYLEKRARFLRARIAEARRARRPFGIYVQDLAAVAALQEALRGPA